MMDRPKFSTTRLREGYSVDDVDATVDRVMADLASGQPSITAAEIQELRFTPVRLGTGYDMGEVDTWLDEVVAELNRRRSGAAETPEPSPPVAEAPRAAETAPPPAPAVEQVGGGIGPTATALAVIGVLALVLVILYVV